MRANLFLLFCLSLPAYGQSNLPPCDSNVASTSWTNCQGTCTTEYLSYVGEFKEGSFNGKGSLTYKNGNTYVGEFRNDMYHGQGTFRQANGYKYVGEFRENKAHGRGISSEPDGSPPREGVFKDNRFVRAQRIPDHIAGRTLETRKLTPKELDEIFRYDPDEYRNVAPPPLCFGPGHPTAAPTVAPADELRVAAKDNEITANTVQVEKTVPQSGDVKPQNTNERRVALVIGNAAYKSAPLDNPLNDATDIANELKRRGFKVITRNNANLRSLQQAVRDFSDEFKKSDVGLIYYSGHGVETKGQNYLIPVDADIRKEYELSAQGYPASQLTEMMEEVQSSDGKKRVAILILDACRDNPLTRSWRSSGRGLARMDAPAGTFISFSTSPGSVASDGRGRNSPFTKHLLQAIRKPDVPIELMFKQVRVGVMDETKGGQIPWDSSSLTGDFYFSRSTKQ